MGGPDRVEENRVDYPILWKYKTDNRVYSVSITSDGEYIVAGGWDKNVYLFNGEGKLLWKYKTCDWINLVSITPDGEYVVAGSGDYRERGSYYEDECGAYHTRHEYYGYIYLFNRKGKLLWKCKTDYYVNLVSITPDGEYVVAEIEDRNIYLFNMEGELLWRYETDGSVNPVSITPDGEYVIVGSGYIYLFNGEGKLLWKYETDGGIESLSITPDGEYVVAGDNDKNGYLLAPLQAILKSLQTKLKDEIQQNFICALILIFIQGILVLILGWDWKSFIVIIINLAIIYFIAKALYLSVKTKALEEI